MRVETFLDYNKTVKVLIDIEDTNSKFYNLSVY